jgi:spermidine synthase
VHETVIDSHVDARIIKLARNGRPLFTHPNPENVLVVGGGDGGVIREILKHPSVKKATLVDIDGMVIEYSKKFLPSIAGKLDDPRVDVRVDDGFMHIAKSENGCKPRVVRLRDEDAVFF